MQHGSCLTDEGKKGNTFFPTLYKIVSNSMGDSKNLLDSYFNLKSNVFVDSSKLRLILNRVLCM